MEVNMESIQILFERFNIIYLISLSKVHLIFYMSVLGLQSILNTVVSIYILNDWQTISALLFFSAHRMSLDLLQNLFT